MSKKKTNNSPISKNTSTIPNASPDALLVGLQDSINPSRTRCSHANPQPPKRNPHQPKTQLPRPTTKENNQKRTNVPALALCIHLPNHSLCSVKEPLTKPTTKKDLLPQNTQLLSHENDFPHMKNNSLRAKWSEAITSKTCSFTKRESPLTKRRRLLTKRRLPLTKRR